MILTPRSSRTRLGASSRRQGPHQDGAEPEHLGERAASASPTEPPVVRRRPLGAGHLGSRRERHHRRFPPARRRGLARRRAPAPPPPPPVTLYRHVDGVTDQVGTHVVGHRITDHLPRAAVQHRSKIHEPDPRADTGDVADPFDSGFLGVEVAAHEVGAFVQVLGRDGGAGPFRRGCAALRPCSRMTARTVSWQADTP